MKTWSRVSAGAAGAAGRLLEGRIGGAGLDLASILTCRDSIRAPLVNGSERLMLAALRSGGKRWPGSGKLARERILWARSILCTADRVLERRFISPNVQDPVQDTRTYASDAPERVRRARAVPAQVRL